VSFDFVGVEDFGELFNLNQWLRCVGHRNPSVIFQLRWIESLNHRIIEALEIP